MNLAGVDYFGHASSVVIDSAKATDATIEQVVRLSQLEELRLGRSAAVGEAGVVHLKRLRRLNRAHPDRLTDQRHWIDPSESGAEQSLRT